MSNASLADVIVRGALGNNSVILDCYAPRAEWSQVRARLHAMLCHTPGFVQDCTDLGMHMEGHGYLFSIHPRWPFVAVIPADESSNPHHPKADGMPQVCISRPHHAVEWEILYQLMATNQMVMQMCKATGSARVLPSTVEPAALLNRMMADGATNVSLDYVLATSVTVTNAGDLRRLFKDPKAYPRRGALVESHPYS